MIDAEAVARRHASLRGADLVSYKEVGLPLWELPLTCLTLATRDLPVLHEFVLRTVRAGLTTLPDITAFLGLDRQITTVIAAELSSNDSLTLSADSLPGEVAFELTAKGERLVTELKQSVPEERTITVYFDGITRAFAAVGNTPLDAPMDLRKLGLEEMPAFPDEPPTAEDLSVDDLQKFLDSIRAGSDAPRSILAITHIEGRRKRYFMRAVALVYEQGSPDDVEVEFAIDGRLSSDHARAFAAAEGKRKLGIIRSLRETADETWSRVVPAEVLAKVTPSEEVGAIRRASDSLRQISQDLKAEVAVAAPGPEREVLEEQIADAEARAAEADSALADLPVRPLEVFEHPQILRDSFSEASSRLLIVSPWVRAGVVDQAFLERLSETLARGVEVFIGYGSGQDDQAQPVDRTAVDLLHQLAADSTNLTVGRLGDTHAKVLAVDEKFIVVTSFNWLSFRGDPNRPFRDERGMMVRVIDTVNEVAGSLIERIREAADAVGR